jgi:hypothetical protein
LAALTLEGTLGMAWKLGEVQPVDTGLNDRATQKLANTIHHSIAMPLAIEVQ